MLRHSLIFAAALAVLVSAQNDGSQRTALDDFVFSDESLSQFSWYHSSEFDYVGTNPWTGVGYSAYVLNMTSGEWLTGNFAKIRIAIILKGHCLVNDFQRSMWERGPSGGTSLLSSSLTT